MDLSTVTILNGHVSLFTDGDRRTNRENCYSGRREAGSQALDHLALTAQII